MIRAALVFVSLTVIMTWPQAAHLATHASPHYDVFFNLWRLRWFAHALATSPTHLFDGNIFYPDPGALTLSDAMLVEGIVAAPLLLIGLPPVLVHNLLLLGAIVVSALGMFVLTRHLTGSDAAGLFAGTVFAFVPYRFDHYMHMELQWAMWVPWTFWALDRTMATGARRYGALCGLFLALQMLSSIYYGIFLSLLLALVSGLLLLPLRRRELRRAVVSLALGAIVAGVICGTYAIPYMETRQKVGGRPDEQVAMFSARASNYLVATPENHFYGGAFQAGGLPERRLFPGVAVTVLAIVGLLLRPARITAIVYLIALVAAFELSLGIRGYSYPFLLSHVAMFEGLRAWARVGLFAVFFLAALGAFGYAVLESMLRPMARRAAAAVAVVVLVAEYWVAPLTLVPYPNKAPLLYQWLAVQPPGIVAEVPLPVPHDLVGAEPEHAYMSTFHWKPLVNGYSGYFPQSYLQRVGRMRGFPDDRSFAQLRHDGVRYLVLHPYLYPSERGREVLEALVARGDLIQLGRFMAVRGDAYVFRIR